MDTDHLQTFLTVARLRSFTRAAAELHLSQPAVSRRIQVLEEQLGERLFERLGRSIHPTAAGLTLVEQARGVLGSLDRLTEALRAHADPEQATLRLGASTTPGLYLLPRVVEELGRDHPGLRCTFVIDNSAAILQRVLANLAPPVSTATPPTA